MTHQLVTPCVESAPRFQLFESTSLSSRWFQNINLQHYTQAQYSLKREQDKYGSVSSVIDPVGRGMVRRW